MAEINPKFYSGKNVLVAGGTGTIGIPVVRKLIELDASVKVASLDTPEFAKKIFGKDCEYVRTDLTDYDNCLAATKNQDHVLNLVGIKGSVGVGESKVASYFVPMLRFQTNLMEAAFRSGASRYLFVGSVCSYPQAEIHHEDNMWNGMPKQNDRIPGIAKRVGELQGETYLKEYGWDAVRIIRPSNVYGPFDDFNPQSAQVIPALIHRMLGDENPVTVWGDGSAVRDFIYSEDVAYWALAALEKVPACTPINLGSGQGYTIKEVAETVAKCVPGNPKIQWDVTKPAGDPRRILSMERAKELLGYKLLTSLEEGIQQTVEWFLANRESAVKKKGVLDYAKSA